MCYISNKKISTDLSYFNSFFSSNEIKKKLNTELASKKVKILNFAGRYCRKLNNIEPEELISETCKRLLEGTRKWKRNIQFIPMFNGAMRSIADERYKNEVLNKKYKLPNNGICPIYDNISNQLPNQEQQITGKKDLKNIRRLFQDDKTAQRFLDMKLDGYKRKDIMSKLSLDSKRYNTVFKKVERRIKKYFNSA